jgi:hypothetical protein
MEALPPRLTLKAGLWQQAALAGILLAALLCAPGCTLDQCWTAKDAPPKGGPCEVATAWLNRVQYTPDVANGGEAIPGLVCRMYLFDETEKHPLLADGGVTITLFDDTHGPTTQPLEQWYIDPVTLKKFLKNDIVGPGYTLFLPWKSCRPDVVKVHLACKYEPAHGTPLFDKVTPLTLEYVPPPSGAPVVMAMPQQPTMPQQPVGPQQLPMPAPLPTR